MTARGHRVAVNLRLDVNDLNGVLLKPSNVDLDVEVTNAIMHIRSMSSINHSMENILRNNSVLRHDLEVLCGDDVPVTSSGDKDVGTRSSLLHGCHLVTCHRSLEGIDGVDLGDEHAGAIGAEGLRALDKV